MKKVMLFFLLCMPFSHVISAELISMHNWVQVGAPSSGDWNVAEDGNSVYQSINGHPTAFVSSEKYSYRTFRGVIQVSEGVGDDDYIGMIYGEPAGGGFYLFSWKQGATGAKNGYTLLYFDGTLDEMSHYGWLVHDEEKGVNTILGKKEGVGWVHGQEYAFELQAYPDRLVAKIDGQVIFDVNDLEIPESRFGFYNWSQGGVRYNSIEQLYPPIAESLEFDSMQGKSLRILAAYSDQNSGDVHTCSYSSPEYGYVWSKSNCSFIYFPSPEHAGVDYFTYTVTDNSGLSTTATVRVKNQIGGSYFEMPHQVEANKTYSISLNQLAPTESEFPRPQINIVNKPSFITYNSQTDSLEITPLISDLGLHKNIEVTFTQGDVEYTSGSYDLLVHQPASDISLTQSTGAPPANRLLRTINEKPAHAFRLPPIHTVQNHLATGIHKAIVHSNSTNEASFIVSNKDIKPGDTSEIYIDLTEEGTHINIYASDTSSRILDVKLEIPNLWSPNDLYYIRSSACSNAYFTPYRCQTTLEINGNLAIEDDIQVIVYNTEDNEFHTMSVDHFLTKLPSFESWLQTLPELRDEHLVLVNCNYGPYGTGRCQQIFNLTKTALGLVEDTRAKFQKGTGLWVFNNNKGVLWQSNDYINTIGWGSSTTVWFHSDEL
ncbi:Ig-like domain-containing protein [Vibrio chaetopteri]|uniref:Ig-like domain-containing protein n=1 Tax=Vibrio chaetopteri TaxID=3016528 RepID=A0AAU8BUJ6_9VIBR